MEKIFGSSLLSLYHYCILLVIIILLVLTTTRPPLPLLFFSNPRNNNTPPFISFFYLLTDPFCALCDFLFPHPFSFFFLSVPCGEAWLIGLSSISVKALTRTVC